MARRRGAMNMYGQGLNSRYDFLLVGKTGYGKSETGNMILGNPNAFDSSSNTDAQTSQVTWSIGRFENRLIKVVDTPGVKDTRMGKEEATRRLAEQAVQAVDSNDRGFHMLLLLFPYGAKFTEEDKEVLYILKSLYGPYFIRNHCAIVMSYGDVFERKERISFADWCARQRGVFRELLAECQGRILLFDNLASPEQRATQVGRLLQMAASVVNENGIYTREIFQTVRPQRNRLIAESQRPRITDETHMQLDLYLYEFAQIMEGDTNDKAAALDQLLTQLRATEDALVRADNGTGVFNDLLRRLRLQRQEISSGRLAEAQRINTEIREESNRWKWYAAIGLIGVFVVGTGAVVYLVGPAAICAAAGAGFETVCSAATVAGQAAYTAAVTAGAASAEALGAAGAAASEAAVAAGMALREAAIIAGSSVGEAAAANSGLSTAGLMALVAAFNDIDITVNVSNNYDER